MTESQRFERVEDHETLGGTHLYVVALDVADAARRRALRRMVGAYGEPVGRDTFEVTLGADGLRGLRAALAVELEEGDRVRIYAVCARCVGRTWLFGGGTLASTPAAWIF
jgi:CRISPR/Cas system-associated endoribonuclease Cas2